MPPTEIHLPESTLDGLRGHLLPRGGVCEEAAFLFAHTQRGPEHTILSVVEVMLIPPEGFASRSGFYLELADATRASIIKRAHDLDAGLIECHSHPGQRGACFSWSDLHGFDDFVPHARWRLAGRPYAAVVFASDSLDALAWIDTSPKPTAIARINAAGRIVRPTGHTLDDWSSIYARRPL